MPTSDKAGCVSKTTYSLTDISPNDKPWDKQKTFNIAISRIFQSNSKHSHKERGEKTNDCSGFLHFAETVNEDTGEVSLKLHDARFCRIRLCPICEWRKSLMWKARFYEALPKIIEDNKNARFLFLTLTVRNCEITELKDTLKLINHAWSKLRKRKAFASCVTGFVKTVEVTRGKDGTAHPHLHVLLMVSSTYFRGDKYLSQKKWTEMWQDCLKVNYVPVVNVKAVKNKKVDDTPLPVAGLKEVLKYAVKPADLVADDKWFIELFEQLAYTRSIALGGYFKNVLSEKELESPEEEDLLLLDEEGDSIDDSQLLMFGYSTATKKYMYCGSKKKLPKLQELYTDLNSGSG